MDLTIIRCCHGLDVWFAYSYVVSLFEPTCMKDLHVDAVLSLPHFNA